MKGRLIITYDTSVSSADSELFSYDLIIDVRDHHITVDQDGTAIITIVGGLEKPKSHTGFEPSTTT